MCTLTILRTREMLTLTMNRDDAPARAEAPPRLWEQQGRRFAAPVDLEAGGTWIGVNAQGLAACLLNRYDEAPKGVRSRGELVPYVLASQNIETAAGAIGAMRHRQYSPFTCLIVSMEAVRRFDWNGNALAARDLCIDAPLMMTSSSWRFAAVAAWRQDLFESTLAPAPHNPVALSAFHCALRANEEAWAPMMRRDYAHTKSVTQIAIGRDAVELRYWPREQAIQRGLTRPDHVLRQPREAMV